MSGWGRTERVAFYDNARFILMALVIVGHFTSYLTHNVPWVHRLYVFIYSFHIPAFALVSGMLAPATWSAKGLKGVATRLLIPFAVFQLFYVVYDHLVFNTLFFKVTFITPYKFMWFLLSLGVWRILLMAVGRFKFGIIVALAGAIALGFFEDAGKPFSFSRTVYFFPFFYLGHLAKKPLAVQAVVPWKRVASVAVLAAAGIAAFSCGDLIEKYWLWGSKSYHKSGWSDLAGPVVRLAFMFAAATLSVAVVYLTPRRKLFFTAAGSRTIYSYVLHGVVVHYLTSELASTRLLKAYGPVVAPLMMMGIGLLVYSLLSFPIVQKVFRPIVEPDPKQAAALLGAVVVLAVGFQLLGSVNYYGTPIAEKPTECVSIGENGLIVKLKKKSKKRRHMIASTPDSEGTTRFFDSRRREVKTKHTEAALEAELRQDTYKLSKFRAKRGIKYLYFEPEKNKILQVCAVDSNR